MKSNLLLLVSFFIFCLDIKSFSQQFATRESGDTTNYPYWQEMMQNRNINFYKTQAAFYKYWENRPVHKGSMYKQFKRWEYINQGRIDAYGNLPKPDLVTQEYFKFKQQYPEQITANWLLVGPTSLPSNSTSQPNGMGRVNGVAFHPTNSDILYAAAPSGGLWYDNEGSWYPLTDNLPTLGTSTVIVDHTNPNIIYIGTGDRDSDDAPGMGVYKSTNSGANFSPARSGMGEITVNMLIMHPTDHLILQAATNHGIYKTTNGGNTWTKKSIYNMNFKDIKYKPGNPLIAYATSGGMFYRSSDGGETWQSVYLGFSASRIVIGVSPAQPDWVYICCARATAPFIFQGLYRSTNSGQSFNLQSSSPNIFGYDSDGDDEREQSGYDLAIAVNPTNANIIYIGGINIWESTDAGVNWELNNHWDDVGNVHADIHSLDYNPLNGVLYCGSDGGLSYTSNGTDWNDLSNGLSISQIYKLGQSNYQQDHVMCGYQDNGTTESDGSTFETTQGGDGLECLIDWGDDDRKYLTVIGDNGPLIIRDVWSGQASIAGYNTNGIDEIPAWELPYMLDRSDADIMYAGFTNVWKSDNIKNVFAVSISWSKISSGETNMCNVIAQPQLDNNILYVSRMDRRNSSGAIVSPASLKRTDTGGSSWISCNLPGGNLVTDIDTHPYDLNIVYATTAVGVYKSTDRGISWENITKNLPAVPKNCIVYEIGPIEALYVATKTGVYYINEFLDEWVPYSNGLPVVDVREIELYYGSGGNTILKAATYGRGLWESPSFKFPAYPTYVKATDRVYPDKINIKWAPATGKPYYKVFRSSFNNSSMAEEISDWITDLEFDDMMPYIGINQYYWVKAATDASGSNASVFSESDYGSTGSASILTEEFMVNTTSTPQYYTYNHGFYGWAIVGIRASEAEAWKIDLFGDNTFQTILATSEASTVNNYVLVDNHHAPTNLKGIKVTQLSGDNDGKVEFENGEETLVVNTASVFEWYATDVVKVYDVHLTPGKYCFSLVVTGGDANLDIALYGSVSGQYYQSRSNALAYSTNPGAGVSETFSFTVIEEDDYALTVFSNDNGTAAGLVLVETAGLWTGYVNNDWHNPGNWTGNSLPDANTDVTIPPMSNLPWIYAGPAVCRNLTIQPGAGTYLRVYDQLLTINGNLTVHRQLMMDFASPNAQIVVNGNVTWESGSTAFFENQTSITVKGNWYFNSGATVHINTGSVTFAGDVPSYIFSNSNNCWFNNLNINKNSTTVILDASSTADFAVNGYFIVYSGSTYLGYSNYKTILRGSLQVLGNMYNNTGITEFNGSSQAIALNEGSFFRHLTINSTSDVILNSNIQARGDILIQSGALSPGSYTISAQGNWTNNVGADGFAESTGLVVFDGGNYAQYCSSETFNKLEINKSSGGAFRVWASIVNCNQYDWTAGAVDVNLGIFQANDLADDGIYGDYYINPLSYVTLTNSDGYVDLNGNIIMSGGEFNVYGGTLDSYWSYNGNAGILMTDGIIDFHNTGISISPSAFSFTAIISGGTIRTTGNLYIIRDGFSPTGGTLKFYGSGTNFISQSSGSLWNIEIDKPSGILGSATNLTIGNDLILTNGTFLVENQFIQIARNMDIHSNVNINHDDAIIRVAGATTWHTGSSVDISANGTFRAAGNWTFNPGSDVHFTNGKVQFVGSTPSSIINSESNSFFNTILCAKTAGSEIIFSDLSADTCNIHGDIIIFDGSILKGESAFPIIVEGLFSNSGHYRFSNGKMVLRNNSASIAPGSGDFFHHLILEAPAAFSFDFSNNDTLAINGNFELLTGGLNINNKILSFGGNWINWPGEAAFIEGTGKVIANGALGILQNINSDETFYNFQIIHKSPSGFADVAMGNEGSFLTVLNDFDITKGRLMMNSGSTLNVGRNFTLANGAALNAQGINPAAINIGGNWSDANPSLSPTSGFNYGTSTVTFNGTSPQYIYQTGLGMETFYNLNSDKSGSTLYPGCNLEVMGNFNLMNGFFENLSDTREFYFHGNVSTVTESSFYPRGNINMVGEINQAFSVNGNGWLSNFTVNKSSSEKQVDLLTNIVSSNSGNLIIYSGILNLNGHFYRCTGDVGISGNGKLLINEDAWLEVGNNKDLNIYGTLEVFGTSGHEAKITHHSGYYNFNVESGGTISAENAIFEFMNTDGINIKSGAIVNEIHPFNTCIFRYGSPSGKLLTVNNSQDITVHNAFFPSNSWSGSYNVSKTTDVGSVIFPDATGGFSGASFEDDSFNRIYWEAPEKSLNITVFLEGLYDGPAMHKAQDETGDHFTGIIADQLTVELHESTAPYLAALSISNVNLNTDGSVSVNVPGTLTGNYYVVIKHRNSLETWSANPVSFSGSSIAYNFSDNISKAYGNNQKEISSIFVIYGGDLNQDGFVDSGDMTPVDNDASNFMMGYIFSDINGDGFVDSADMTIIDNNAANFISVITP
ncbi:MAG: hypothetical protein M0R21_03255 [Lentimicrobiaceae bacterium]|nr:hypothetical protein [Lentimicrobiaceae bacterium]